MTTATRYGLVMGIAGLIGASIGYLSQSRPTIPAAAPSRQVAEAKQPNTPGDARPNGAYAASAMITGQDFSDALGNAITRPSHLRRWHDLVELSRVSNLNDAPRLLKALQAIPGYQANEILGLFFAAWAMPEPESALAESLKISSDAGQTAAVVGILQAWMRTDEKSALKWLEGQKTDLRYNCLLTLARAQFRDGSGNPAAYIRAALELAGDPDVANINSRRNLHRSLTEALEAWARNDPVLAGSEAMRLKDTSERSSALHGVFRGWIEKDPAAAVGWFQQLNFPDDAWRAIELATFAEQLAWKDPKTAIVLVSEEPAGATRSRAIGAVAIVLLQNDPSAAVGFISQVPPEDSEKLKDGFYYAWLRQDPQAALADVSRRIDALDSASPVRERLMFLLTNEFTRSVAATENPQPLAEYYASETDPRRAALLTEVTSRWAERDPSGAQAWIESQKDETVRARAVMGMAEGWSYVAPGDAGQWVAALPPGPFHNAAVDGYARGLFPTDPDSAIEVIRSISDPTERLAHLQTAWWAWSRSPGGEAVRWRDQASILTDAERTALKGLQPAKLGE